MSGRFRPLALEQLTAWIADELETKSSVCGVPSSLFFIPSTGDRFRTRVFGVDLETPVGVAAGPHSQLAQNIVVAWLCGARFIELKTVQILDGIEVPKPCIDMQDEGYNVEWSQELSVEESFGQYLQAWVLIHALHRRLGFPGPDPGVCFNLSVGYDLRGIRGPKMQTFLDRVEKPGEQLEHYLEVVAQRFPEVRSPPIPTRMADNVTLSTMHGCPPDEITAIAAHLLEDRSLHTSVKLNPTLLGAEEVREILGARLGYEDIRVPDRAFEEDLAYPDALLMLRELQTTASACGLDFGVKLTNTLAVENHRGVLGGHEDTVYLSGRPLHALTVRLAERLADDLEALVSMSFSGGADADNIASLLAAGMRTVTVCSDLLKPGGYLRLGQYLDTINRDMEREGTRTIDELILARAGDTASTTEEAARCNLHRYAKAVLDDPAYQRDTFDRSHTKTARLLGLFDCILAPCTDACDVDQRVPDYMRRVREGDCEAAAAVVRQDNPLAAILGRACHHPCEPVCLRTHIDRPLAIREIKRFITEHEPPGHDTPSARPDPASVAIVGAGPCGLAAATFLARAGHRVVLFEARPTSGGMVSATIPGYRAARRAVEQDLAGVRALGVEIRHGMELGRNMTFATLRGEGFDHIVLAVGARLGLKLGIADEDAAGVVDGLEFLRSARTGKTPALGTRVGVVGGGDVAMDCARTALRLGADRVEVFYRRTRAEMPAQGEEVLDLLREGATLRELVAPRRVLTENGRLKAVELARMRLGEPDASGRRRPEEIPDSSFEVAIDTLIVAIGQRPDLGFLADEETELTPAGYLAVDPETLETSLPGIFAGGDIVGDGPASIVKAAGDGRRIAAAINAQHGVAHDTAPPPPWPEFDTSELLARRSRREERVTTPRREVAGSGDFSEVILTLSPEEASREAARCLDCDLMCSTCEGVCPNRAILTYRARPASLLIPRLRISGASLTADGATEFRIEQGPQVAVIADYCNECGNCVTFCPTSGRPWRDKPRLHFHRGDFEAEADNAFMLLSSHGAACLQAMFGGELHELVSDGAELRYASPAARMSMSPETLAVRAASFGPSPRDREIVEPQHLATMFTLLRSLSESMPELPAVEADAAWLLWPAGGLD
jgi:putative selenate reductase